MGVARKTSLPVTLQMMKLPCNQQTVPVVDCWWYPLSRFATSLPAVASHASGVAVPGAELSMLCESVAASCHSCMLPCSL